MHLRLNRVRIANAVVGGLVLLVGCTFGRWLLAAAGAATAGYALARMLGLGAKRTATPAMSSASTLAEDIPSDDLPVVAASRGEDAGDMSMLIEEMLLLGRHALLLRPQIVNNLNADQYARTRAALQETMSITPAGEVALGPLGSALDDGELSEREIQTLRPTIVWVESLYLDRYPVTNRQFYQFVASGGYQQMALWEPEVWPAIIDFVDETGLPGPRFWHDGRYRRGEENHPVVGVSWYEAAAYSRWVGKRLPTDAEWTKAASWPVSLANKPRKQRKYPWGDAMDRNKANLWGSPGGGKTVPVERFADGASPGGVYQLIGNVWEWQAEELSGETGSSPADLDRIAFRSLRGGAFDTYFDSQATTDFQSGDHPLARKHNIGFRCALGLCDLAEPDSQTPDNNFEPAPEALEEAGV